MNIMFTSVGRRVELVRMFKASAEKLGAEVKIYGADLDMTAPALYFCHERLQLPPIKSEKYIPTLLELCQKHNIALLIPTIDTDLLVLAQNAHRFAEINTKVLISSEENISICRDKRKTAQYFHSLGLHSPMPTDDINNYNDGFPAFIKPLDGSSSVNAFAVSDMAELKEYASRVPDYIIQPFIKGREYTVDVFCDMEGNPIYITPRIRLAVRAGEVLKTQIRQDESIIAEVEKLISHYKPCGPITVQLIKEEKTDINWYIEINPRFGGGAPLSMKAGANSSEALIRILQGEELSYCPCAARDLETYCRFDDSVKV